MTGIEPPEEKCDHPKEKLRVVKDPRDPDYGCVVCECGVKWPKELTKHFTILGDEAKLGA